MGLMELREFYESKEVDDIKTAIIEARFISKETKEELIDVLEGRMTAVKLMDKQDELLKQARKAGIKMNWKDKFVKGMKEQGPKKWRKFNVDVLQRAIDNNEKTVTLWAG